METLTLLRFWKQQHCSQWSWLTRVLSYHSHWINLKCVKRHLYQNRKAEFVRHFREQKSSLSVGPPLAAASAGVHQHTEQMAEFKPKPVIISQAKRQQVMVCRALWQVISTLLPHNLCRLWGFQSALLLLGAASSQNHFLCKCYNFHLGSAHLLIDLSLPTNGFSG